MSIGRWGARAQDATPYEILRGRSHADIQREMDNPSTSEGRRKQLKDALAEAESGRLKYTSTRDPFRYMQRLEHKFIPSREQH